MSILHFPSFPSLNGNATEWIRTNNKKMEKITNSSSSNNKKISFEVEKESYLKCDIEMRRKERDTHDYEKMETKINSHFYLSVMRLFFTDWNNLNYVCCFYKKNALYCLFSWAVEIYFPSLFHVNVARARKWISVRFFFKNVIGSSEIWQNAMHLSA